MFCTITEQLITSKIQSSDLDKLKKTAVECMKDYIEHSQFLMNRKNMHKISDKCIVKNDMDETIAYACVNCGLLTTRVSSLNNWKIKDQNLYCPQCVPKL